MIHQEDQSAEKKDLRRLCLKEAMAQEMAPVLVLVLVLTLMLALALAQVRELALVPV